MKSKLLAGAEERTYALIFETGDEPVSGIEIFAKQNQLNGSHLTAIGAFEQLTLAYFDWEEKKYRNIEMNEQVEVVSLVGDIALSNGEPKLHAHAVVAKRDGSAYGGHLIRATVRPTLEVILTEAPEHLRRVHDPETGLALIRL
jgi:predicted DNA-binding protein with PD1-like motif